MTFLEEYQRRLGEWSDVQYCMPQMLERASRYPQVAVLELGVQSGNSTSAFLAAAEKNGGHVWSADTEPPDVPAHWRGSGLWTFLQGDDLLLDPPEHEFDLVFIDTSHHYGHTLAELRKYVPLVAVGGTVLLHDSLLAHVDYEPLPYPVTLAISTFCKETGRGWIEHGGRTGFAEIERPNG
jgi:predicted O-methyltransferase YrrM